jgi:multidrug efflux pump subunit AcrB
MRDISSRGLTSGRPNPISFNLRGPNIEKLLNYADDISKKLTEKNLAVDMDKDLKGSMNEILIVPDRNAMAERGVSIESVSLVLNAGIAGIKQSRFSSDGHRYDIRVKFPNEFIKSVDNIKKIYLRNSQGNLVPLSNLVQINESKSLQNINRINRQRSVGVYGSLPLGVSQAKALDEAKAISDEVLPSGYSFSLEGSAAGLKEVSKV